PVVTERQLDRGLRVRERSRQVVRLAQHPTALACRCLGGECGSLHTSQREDEVDEWEEQHQRHAEELDDRVAALLPAQSREQRGGPSHSSTARPVAVMVPDGPSRPSTGIGARTVTSTSISPSSSTIRAVTSRPYLWWSAAVTSSRVRAAPASGELPAKAP